MGTVLSFRQIAERGFHAAMQVYEAEVMQFLQHQVSRPDPIVDPSVLGGMADAVSKMITQTTAEQAKASVDAASLIFTHSILDGAAFDY